MTDYSLHIPFGIDDGELGDSSIVRAFTLGFEFGEVVGRMQRVESSDLPFIVAQVHTENLGRLRAVASKMRLRVREKWINDDWAEIRVRRWERAG